MDNDMLKENALQNKTILVTGGGSGLGKSMSEYFLKLGAKVVIGSRNKEKIDNCVNEFSDLYGNNIIGTACDVRHYDHVENLIKYSEILTREL